ncbi:helix-turn-helix domain-containing protein [Mesorhizobium sp. ZC-5]|uniref:helix-turn-helix domain-containing protein n=1 Tax=Mesorhizobium sp. ZC-5 TaxID=2986066 RepID=UPI0021E7BFFD|nr:AraC family transcriptional regulator [Mesorhizobium sp. ZC-5]MCV3241744.1 AraC family transcriptional regulator [Mesorhizobium sp. ZC-5]
MDVGVAEGGFYIVGPEPTTLLKVPEFSDTLEMYPDMTFLQTTADQNGQSAFFFRSTLDGSRRPYLPVNREILPLALVLRQVCLGRRSLSAIEASSLEHLLATHIVGASAPLRGDGKLAPEALQRVLDLIEDELHLALTLDHLAGEARLSAFHFARSFKRSTGFAPHKYVLARKIERAKQQLITTNGTVETIATSLGFENLHNFRRHFQAHLGVLPHVFRDLKCR